MRLRKAVTERKKRVLYHSSTLSALQEKPFIITIKTNKIKIQKAFLVPRMAVKLRIKVYLLIGEHKNSFIRTLYSVFSITFAVL